MTVTLHIENTVRDFAEWKSVFDKFERFRTERNVRAYRISQQADAPERVLVDLDFDSVDEAAEFGRSLAKVRTTPQSQAQLVDSREPTLYILVAAQSLDSTRS